jgi:hypothetical protein
MPAASASWKEAGTGRRSSRPLCRPLLCYDGRHCTGSTAP